MLREHHTQRYISEAEGRLVKGVWHKMRLVRPAQEGQVRVSKAVMSLDFTLCVIGIIGKLFRCKRRRAAARMQPQAASSTM